MHGDGDLVETVGLVRMVRTTGCTSFRKKTLFIIPFHDCNAFQPTIWLWSQMWYFVTVNNAFLFHLWDLVIYIFEKVTSRVYALLNSALDWVITPSWWTKQSWRHIIKLEIAHNLRTRVRKIFNCAIFNIKKIVDQYIVSKADYKKKTFNNLTTSSTTSRKFDQYFFSTRQFGYFTISRLFSDFCDKNISHCWLGPKMANIVSLIWFDWLVWESFTVLCYFVPRNCPSPHSVAFIWRSSNFWGFADNRPPWEIKRIQNLQLPLFSSGELLRFKIFNGQLHNSQKKDMHLNPARREEKQIIIWNVRQWKPKALAKNSYHCTRLDNYYW